MVENSKKYKIGGYVKRAKLNLRNGDDVKAFHRGLLERLLGSFEDGELVDVYIDITGYKETSKRPEMLRLMRDCAEGKVNLVFAETKGYLAANTSFATGSTLCSTWIPGSILSQTTTSLI